jgi:hypothetical protein
MTEKLVLQQVVTFFSPDSRARERLRFWALHYSDKGDLDKKTARLLAKLIKMMVYKTIHPPPLKNISTSLAVTILKESLNE